MDAKEWRHLADTTCLVVRSQLRSVDGRIPNYNAISKQLEALVATKPNVPHNLPCVSRIFIYLAECYGMMISSMIAAATWHSALRYILYMTYTSPSHVNRCAT
jgi:hypothetical protein